MSVQSDTSRVQYVGNGSTVTPYPTVFRYLDPSHVKVVVTAFGEDTILEEGAGYVLDNVGPGTDELYTGSVTTTEEWSDSYQVTIYREVPATQPAVFEENSAMRAKSIEQSLDRVIMVAQQVQRIARRAIRFSESSPEPAEIVLGSAINRVIGLDGVGQTKLYTAEELRNLLETAGTLPDYVKTLRVWADDGARGETLADYTGQVGVQLDDNSIWISTGTDTNWEQFALEDYTPDELEPSSPTDEPNPRRPLSEQGAANLIQYHISRVNQYPPVGTVIAWAGSSMVGVNAPDPNFWLLCDGSEVSRESYADLFDVVGTTYGVGDGSTTFNLPDLRDRVIAGVGNMGGTTANRLTVTLTGNFSSGVTSITNLSSTGSLCVGMKVIGNGIPNGATIAAINTSTTITLSTNTTAPGTGATLRFGMVDSVTLGATGGSGVHTLTSVQMPAHTHSQNAPTSGSGGAVKYGTDTDASGTQASGLSTDSAGGGQAHPNVQPTIALNFLIRH